MAAPPDWCDTPELREHWNRPWRVPTDGRKARVFKRRLRKHGLLSPNFSIKEASFAGTNPDALPEDKIGRAQVQAFHLERLRHANGDRPLGILSWYRSPSHNAAVGGASASRHMSGDACDFADTQDYSTCERIWGNHGGLGTYQGRVRHADCRGYAARWSYG